MAAEGGLAEVVTFGARFYAELGQKRLMRAYFETKVNRSGRGPSRLGRGWGEVWGCICADCVHVLCLCL